MKNLTEFRKTVEAGVDPRLGIHLEMSAHVLVFLFISNNLCDFSKQRGLISFELVIFIIFSIFFRWCCSSSVFSNMFVVAASDSREVGTSEKKKQARNKQTNRQKRQGEGGTTPSLPSPSPFLFLALIFLFIHPN